MDILTHDWRQKTPAAVRSSKSRQELLGTIACRFIDLAVDTQASQPFFSIILGGGRTPKELNRAIVELPPAKKVNWNRVNIFFSDERCVPPTHDDSNYKLILNTLIEPLRIPSGNVSRIPGEMEPREAASGYHNKLAAFGGKQAIPVFDLALLGLGPDGHTASLFPGSPALNRFDQFAAFAGTGPEGWSRITLTYPPLNAAKNVWIMAFGAAKSRAVQQLIRGPYNPPRLPAQAVRPKNGNLVYWLDGAAIKDTDSLP
ncbi:MAG: 6-phosphogluconolactonase [bacterium]|nr:6-phosphogluconolactonase [bacterium]